jgi:hypothetical protein
MPRRPEGLYDLAQGFNQVSTLGTRTQKRIALKERKITWANPTLLLQGG